MPTAFSATELANMRSAQQDHMMDQCEILSYTAGTANEYNEQDAPTYPTTYIGACGLDMQPGSENDGDDYTAIQHDAIIRLPVGTQVKETDRIRIISRFGEYPNTLTFEIVSPIRRGPSGIRLLVKKVVT
jgi:hypothetical protein